MVDDPLKPADLMVRGRALWAELVCDPEVPASRKVLAGEACRLADRLDRLDMLLSGDVESWASLTHKLLTQDYELKIDGAAAEARQAAAALRQILSQLAADSTSKASGGSLADELAARRADREANASG